MNKVILMGRLTRDCEVRYTQSQDALAIVRFSIAVNRRFKREGDPDADFFNCVCFGKMGETINRYFKKGNMISIVGSVRNNNWTDNNGLKRYSVDIHVDEFYFCGEKNDSSGSNFVSSVSSAPANSSEETKKSEGFYDVDESVVDEDLPF